MWLEQLAGPLWAFYIPYGTLGTFFGRVRIRAGRASNRVSRTLRCASFGS